MSSQTTIVLGVDGTPVSTGAGTADAGTIRVVNATGGGGGSTVDGTKTNNDAAPGANNLGVLGAVATVASPAYSEGNLVALSTDLTGALRVSGAGGGGTVDQGTPAVIGNRWPVQLTDGVDLALVSGAGALLTDASATTQPVSAAALPLPAGAATSALQTQPGVDIGDVTVNNAAGASAVNVQDGGNTLTVDSLQLPAALVGGRLDGNVGAWIGSTAPSVGSKTSANSVPVVIASDQGAVAISGTVTTTLGSGTDRIGGAYDVGGNVIDEVPTVRTINRSFVNATASGNTEAVPAQGVGVRIRVLSVMSVTSTAVSVKFQSAASDVSGTFPIAANGGFVMPETQHGWFQTNANEALNVNLSGAATNVGVQVIWVQAS